MWSNMLSVDAKVCRSLLFKSCVEMAFVSKNVCETHMLNKGWINWTADPKHSMPEVANQPYKLLTVCLGDPYKLLIVMWLWLSEYAGMSCYSPGYSISCESKNNSCDPPTPLRLLPISVADPDLELRGGAGFFEMLKQNWFANIACPASFSSFSVFSLFYFIFFLRK